MSNFVAKIEFDGGCFNCPLCIETLEESLLDGQITHKRRCALSKEHVHWRFKGKKGFPVDSNGSPIVDTVFDPYLQRLKSCQLKKK
jgi:hypothetical protein